MVCGDGLNIYFRLFVHKQIYVLRAVKGPLLKSKKEVHELQLSAVRGVQQHQQNQRIKS
jgi:hypothetical protein